jgi:hypothetical protein
MKRFRIIAVITCLTLIHFNVFAQARLKAKEITPILTGSTWKINTIWERNRNKEYGPLHDYEISPTARLFEIGFPDSLTFLPKGKFTGKVIRGSTNDIPEYSMVSGTWKLKGTKLLFVNTIEVSNSNYWGYIPDENNFIEVAPDYLILVGEKWYDGGYADFKIRFEKTKR